MIKLKEIAWKRRISLQGETLQHVKKLDQWQWLSHEQMEELQKRWLTSLLRHAYEHCSYYRKILTEAQAVLPDGTVLLEHFRQIPLLERETFHPHFEELKSDDFHHRKWYLNWSGGSTGEPIRLLQDRRYFNWNQAVKIQYDQWSGKGLVDRQIVLWGSERDLMVGHETWKTYMGRWMRNERWFNTRYMSPKHMKAYVEEWNQYRPVQILTYAESIYELARFIEENNLYIYPPKSIMTTASVLHPHMRTVVERVFQTTVFNRYGSREIGAIACECEHHSGLHISAPTHYVEILDTNGNPIEPGVQGELVITSLHNYTMPIIRYRIGDTATWATQPCSCGRQLPMLKEIGGRVTDLFVRRDGGLVDGRLFILLLGTLPFIKKFQVYQGDFDTLTISIILKEQVEHPELLYQAELQMIREKSRALIGDDCQIVIRFVDDIPATASGKYRYTISAIKR
ncbi:MAG: phenylacetate--CoA ligase family protein [Clostridia bacterium]